MSSRSEEGKSTSTMTTGSRNVGGIRSARPQTAVTSGIADKSSLFTSAPSTKARQGLPASFARRAAKTLPLMIVRGNDTGAIITSTPAMSSQRSGCCACQRSNSSTVHGRLLSARRLAIL